MNLTGSHRPPWGGVMIFSQVLLSRYPQHFVCAAYFIYFNSYTGLDTLTNTKNQTPIVVSYYQTLSLYCQPL